MNTKLIITVFSAVVLVTTLCADATDDAKLSFISDSPFAVSATNGWNGTMESSTDSKNWSTWDGDRIGSDFDNASRKYVLYFRGTNTVLSQEKEGKYWPWTLEGSAISCSGNIESLLDYKEVEAGKHPKMAMNCFRAMFSGCTNLVCTPELPAVTLAENCYYDMFKGCTMLSDLPVLPGTNLVSGCYGRMFMGCTNIYLSAKTKMGKRWALPSLAVVLDSTYNTSMLKGAGNENLSTVTTNTLYYLPNIKLLLNANWVSLDWTNYPYTASIQKPTPIVNDGSRTFVYGADYTYSYSNPESREVGLYTVTVSGTNAYTGDVVRTYAILGVIEPSSGATVVTNAATSVEEAISTVVLTPPKGASVSEADYRSYFKMEAKSLGNNLYEVAIGLDADKLEISGSVQAFATNLMSIATKDSGWYTMTAKPGLYYGVIGSKVVDSGYTSGKKSLAKNESVTVQVARPSSTNGFFKVVVSAAADKVEN